MPQWQQVVLIIVGFGALIIALYCLFFMVPVKRFWERINSLGGGIEGVESHVAGVHDEIAGRLAALEEATREQIAENREAVQSRLDRLAKDSHESQRELERLRKDVQALQAGLRQAGSDNMKVNRSLESLAKQLQQLRGDFDALDVELRESVRQLVSDSFNTVESTVLSALDAVQEEILYGASEPSSRPTKVLPPRQKPERRPPSGLSTVERGPGDKIIPMEPLFAGLHPNGEKPPPEEEQSTAEESAPDEKAETPKAGSKKRTKRKKGQKKKT
ncbi:MAG: hypothetical protein ACYTFZ_01380 [Planctomycetota bacterium]|jgi:archaellum component FlaC